MTMADDVELEVSSERICDDEASCHTQLKHRRRGARLRQARILQRRHRVPDVGAVRR